MISLLISFFYFLSIFSNHLQISNKDESKYVIFSSSLIFALGSTGLISMFLINFNLLDVPIFLIQLVLFFLIVDCKNFNYKLKNFKDFFLSDFKLIRENYSDSILIVVCSVFFLYFLVSFGPINQSDTVNYYVGYPFQFYLNKSHFIDGDLAQGLLGIGDFANLAFIQEKSIWLIRLSQFIPLVPTILLFSRRKTPFLLLLIFLSSPVFIQWLTIGKYTFLGDSCLSLIYLCWRKDLSFRYLLPLLSAGLISISIKISSILIILPIFFDVIFFYKKEIRNLIFSLNREFFKDQIFIFLFSFLPIISIFFYRFYLTGNFFYPIFSSIFTPGNSQYYDWELLLRNFDKEKFFQFWLFLPKNPSKIASVLGPATGFIFINFFFLMIRKLISSHRIEINIGFFQLLLLFLFAQGRADYYCSPLILLFCGNKFIPSIRNLSKENINLDKFFNFLFKVGIFFQIIIFSISIFYMICLNFYTIFNYEIAMNKTAYGFYNSKIIQNNLKSPVLSLVDQPPRLFYDFRFIPDHKYWECFKYSGLSNDIDKKEYCINKLKAKTIIVKKDYFKDNKKFICKEILFKETPRNIFKSSSKVLESCAYNKKS